MLQTTRGQCGSIEKSVIFLNNDFFPKYNKYGWEKGINMQLVISLRNLKEPEQSYKTHLTQKIWKKIQLRVNLKKIVGRGVRGLFLFLLDERQIGVTFDLHVQIRGKKHLVWILPSFSHTRGSFICSWEAFCPPDKLWHRSGGRESLKSSPKDKG